MEEQWKPSHIPVLHHGALLCLPEQANDMTDLNLFHLELLHHFCTVTYQTLSSEPAQQEIWQVVVVKYGLRFPFLMFELLATSALHMGYLNPDKRDFYSQKAMELQAKGLNGFNVLQREVNSTNAGAILIFSSLISLHVFANPLRISAAELPEYLQHFLQSVKLMQSVRGLIIDDWWECLSKSEFKAFFDVPRVEKPYNIPNECQDLEALTKSSTTDVREACDPAIDRLQWLYAVSGVPSQEHSTLRWLLAWPARLESRYLAELDKRTPEAFVILAHYAIILHFYRESWAVGNAGRDLIEAIDAVINERWKGWLRWPRQITGL